jgi:hypothetical protein
MKLYWKSTAPNEYMMFLQMTGFGPCVSPALSSTASVFTLARCYNVGLTRDFSFGLQPLERQQHSRIADCRADG